MKPKTLLLVVAILVVTISASFAAAWTKHPAPAAKPVPDQNEIQFNWGSGS